MTPTPHNLAGDRSRGLGLLNLRLRAQMRTFLVIMLAAAAGALLAGGGTIALLCSRQVISVFLWRQFARLQIILFGNENTFWRPWDPAVTWSNYQLVVDPYTTAGANAVRAARPWAIPAALLGAILPAALAAWTQRCLGMIARRQCRTHGRVFDPPDRRGKPWPPRAARSAPTAAPRAINSNSNPPATAAGAAKGQPKPAAARSRAAVQGTLFGASDLSSRKAAKPPPPPHPTPPPALPRKDWWME